jgi:hypothetical protein
MVFQGHPGWPRSNLTWTFEISVIRLAEWGAVDMGRNVLRFWAWCGALYAGFPPSSRMDTSARISSASPRLMELVHGKPTVPYVVTCWLMRVIWPSSILRIHVRSFFFLLLFRHHFISCTYYRTAFKFFAYVTLTVDQKRISIPLNLPALFHIRSPDSACHYLTTAEFTKFQAAVWIQAAKPKFLRDVSQNTQYCWGKRSHGPALQKCHQPFSPLK